MWRIGPSFTSKTSLDRPRHGRGYSYSHVRSEEARKNEGVASRKIHIIAVPPGHANACLSADQSENDSLNPGAGAEVDSRGLSRAFSAATPPGRSIAAADSPLVVQAFSDLTLIRSFRWTTHGDRTTRPTASSAYTVKVPRSTQSTSYAGVRQSDSRLPQTTSRKQMAAVYPVKHIEEPAARAACRKCPYALNCLHTPELPGQKPAPLDCTTRDQRDPYPICLSPFAARAPTACRHCSGPATGVSNHNLCGNASDSSHPWAWLHAHQSSEMKPKRKDVITPQINKPELLGRQTWRCTRLEPSDDPTSPTLGGQSSGQQRP